MLEVIKDKFDRFIDVADKEVSSRPWLIVILMHEYFRNLYPEDPYIPLESSNGFPMLRISRILDHSIETLNSSKIIGSYFDNISNLMDKIESSSLLSDDMRQEEGTTQRVYGKLWDKYETDEYIKEAYRIIESRFKNNEFDLSVLKGKTILDMGCGSGRYTIALTKTGAEKVYGIDLGKESIRKAALIAEKSGIRNIEFDVGSVLDLPYEDNLFDFIYSNGVLHHTENLEQGINELYRTLKPGGESFLYLYADGGIFWYSRKKMPRVMKKIPQSYTMAILDLLGMPNNRFIFCDNWYVPIERHISKDYLENYLKEVGFTLFKKIISGRATDLDSIIASDSPQKKEMWGDGEHRYLLKK
jgi:ubiquinone/menaquinone biosynthesis C-methylase UbiE